MYTFLGFFVANPNFDDEAATCQRFNDACYRLDGNGSVQITSDCEVRMSRFT